MILAFGFTIFGVGLSFIKPSFNKETYSGFIVEVKDNYFILSSSLEKLYVYEPAHDREIGDYVSIKGDKQELDFVTLESEFDFKEYLNKHGVYSELLVKDIEVKFYNPIRIHKFKENFLYKFDENSRGIISSILFSGSKEGDLVEISSELHLMRLISSSGIYLSFFFLILNKLISIFIKKDKIAQIVSIILFLPYLVFTFPKFIVIKFFILKVIMWINRYPLKGRFRYLDILAFTGIIFLLFDYHLAYQDGFRLSYFIPILSLLINDSFNFDKKIKKTLFLTLVISISFIPFASNYYHEISIMSVPIQVVYTPIYLVLFLLAVLSLIGIPLFSFISSYASIINKSLNFLSPIFIKIYVHPFSEVATLLFELAVLILLFFLSIRLKPIYKAIGGFLLVTLSLYFSPILTLFSSYVSFINVGQGDSTLIKYKTSTILIDTGGLKNKDVATEILIPYFKSKQIYEIDMLITTHEDFDHSGGVNSLIENYKVSSYVKDYKSFPLNINGLVLNNYNVYPELWNEENDRSLVIGFNLNNLDYLIMGDAPIKIEKEIIKNNKSIPCDILKVGHHGSKTSTCEEFIKFLKPKYGIISCGKNNYYGHPHSQVLAVLNKYHVIIRRTDLESTITF